MQPGYIVMSLIQLLNHPKESFFKHYFVLTTLLLFVLLPMGKMLFDYHIFLDHPWVQNTGYSPYLVTSCLLFLHWSITGLITYFMLSHSVKKNRNGLLTFFVSTQALRLLGCIFALSLQRKGVLPPTVFAASTWQLFSFYITEFLLNPVWLYFAWSLRRVNQLNQIRETISSSPEAMQHLQNLENPTSPGMIDQVMNYLYFRLPPSQQKLIAPLKIEAKKRLEFADLT
jgi:hypothetical protein